MAAKISEETKLDWLRLIRSDHVGPHTFGALLSRYGGARAALEALPDLARRGGAAGPLRIYPRENAERELAAMRALGVGLLAMSEADYPQRLAMIDDAPPLLAVRGNVATLGLPMVAIVGARNASAAGVRFAERLARELGEAGFAIVSGLARGIDAGAHRGSLASGWREDTIKSIRPSMPASPMPSLRKARSPPRCRWAGSRAHAIFPAATGSFPEWLPAS
jgi:DNA processing protein